MPAKKTDTDLTIQEAATPASMLASAIAKGMDAQSIQTLTDVYFQFEQRRAEREYNEAMAAFQHECPVVLKKTTIEFPTKRGGKFSSKYAEMDDIIEATRELRYKHGFSYTFKHRFDKEITSVCEVSHVGGHTRATEVSLPLPKDVLISEAHSAGGAITFADRYSFRAAFGIATGLPDDDGKGLIGKIPKEQVEQLEALIKETKCEQEETFWTFCKVHTISDLPATEFGRVYQALMIRRKRMQEAQQGGQS